MREQSRAEDHGGQDDPAQVQQQGKLACRPAPGSGAGEAQAGQLQELGQALVDQVETHVPGTTHNAALARVQRGARTRQVHGLARHLAFRQAALPGDLLGGMAIAIAAGKIHPDIDATRILA